MNKKFCLHLARWHGQQMPALLVSVCPPSLVVQTMISWGRHQLTMPSNKVNKISCSRKCLQKDFKICLIFIVPTQASWNGIIAFKHCHIQGDFHQGDNHDTLIAIWYYHYFFAKIHQSTNIFIYRKNLWQIWFYWYVWFFMIKYKFFLQNYNH